MSSKDTPKTNKKATKTDKPLPKKRATNKALVVSSGEEKKVLVRPPANKAKMLPLAGVLEERAHNVSAHKLKSKAEATTVAEKVIVNKAAKKTIKTGTSLEAFSKKVSALAKSTKGVQKLENNSKNTSKENKISFASLDSKAKSSVKNQDKNILEKNKKQPVKKDVKANVTAPKAKTSLVVEKAVKEKKTTKSTKGKQEEQTVGRKLQPAAKAEQAPKKESLAKKSKPVRSLETISEPLHQAENNQAAPIEIEKKQPVLKAREKFTPIKQTNFNLPYDAGDVDEELFPEEDVRSHFQDSETRERVAKLGIASFSKAQARALASIEAGYPTAVFAKKSLELFSVLIMNRLRSDELKQNCFALVCEAQEEKAQLVSLLKNLLGGTVEVHSFSSQKDQTPSSSPLNGLVILSSQEAFNENALRNLKPKSIFLFCIDTKKHFQGVLGTLKALAKVVLFDEDNSALKKDLIWRFFPSNTRLYDTVFSVASPIKLSNYILTSKQKFQCLLGVLSEEPPSLTVVYANSKTVAQWIAHKLSQNDKAVELCLDTLYPERKELLRKLCQEKKVEVIVTVDHVESCFPFSNLGRVVNFDLPDEPLYFLKRCQDLSSYAGSDAKIVSFVCDEFGQNFQFIQKDLGIPLVLKEPEESLLAVLDKSTTPIREDGTVKFVKTALSSFEPPRPQQPQEQQSRPIHRIEPAPSHPSSNKYPIHDVNKKQHDRRPERDQRQGQAHPAHHKPRHPQQTHQDKFNRSQQHQPATPVEKQGVFGKVMASVGKFFKKIFSPKEKS